MIGSVLHTLPDSGHVPVAHAGFRTPQEIFTRIFTVFLVLGTIIGVLVTIYLMYYAVRNRVDGEWDPETEKKRPDVGELPSGTDGGRKLLLSFTLSAIVVVGLIFWTYGFLLEIEQGPPVDEEALGDTSSLEYAPTTDPASAEVKVVGEQFRWVFHYPSDEGDIRTTGTMYVPNDTAIRLIVTSNDVFHNFGISRYNIKTDAIPGQKTTTWFAPEETGSYTARCYELCGNGHSGMTATVVVVETDVFESCLTGASNGSAFESCIETNSNVAGGAA